MEAETGRRSQVVEQQESLSKAIARLDESLKELANRLTRVLRQPSPQCKEDAERDLVGLANDLAIEVGKLLGLCEQIDSIIDRLEL